MSYNLASQKYINTSHNTVSKTLQIIMLYDGAINALTKAKSALADGDIQDKYNNITTAVNIITGLQACIDFENGGEPAQLLNNFYNKIYMQMMKQHTSPEIGEIDHIIKEIKMMREAWDFIDKNQSSGPSSANMSLETSPDISA